MQIRDIIIHRADFIGICLIFCILPTLSIGDIFILKNGQSLNGIVLSESTTELEIQTISSKIILPLSRISHWSREPNLQSYYRLSQDAFNEGKFDIARDFLNQALKYDPQNAALLAKRAEIDFSQIEKNEVGPIRALASNGKMQDYLNAIRSMEKLITQHEEKPYINKLDRELANIRVNYALYLFNFVRDEEAFDQLRLARRIDENNQSLHLALAKIQEKQGNQLLAKLEEDRAMELAEAEKEQAEILNQIIASVGETMYDDLPSEAYWAEQARIAELAKSRKTEASFALIPVDNWIRILLQAYNAGPGAVVVYEGSVPYRETVNYVRSISNWLNRVPESNGYEHLIKKYTRKYGLDDNLVRALIKVESDFNPRARSKADARGLMQITSLTWKDTVGRLGVNWSFSKHAYDPEKNIEVGCHYLAWLKNEYLPKHFNMARVDSTITISRLIR